jgi:hypothetical protein
MDEAERLEFGHQGGRMITRQAAIFRPQGLCQESFDFEDVMRRFGKQIDDSDRRGIQQVGIPGDRIKDRALLAEIMDPKPLGAGKSDARGDVMLAIVRAHAFISDE